MTFYGRFLSLVVVIVALYSLSVSATDCEAITSKSSCTASKCSWCTSGAVGSSCMTNADAAGLPSSVFTCTSTVSAAIEEKDYSSRTWMGDVEYGRTHPQLFESFNQTIGATAASYPSDPYGYSTLYLSEFAYCGNFMSAHYSHISYTKDFVPTKSFSVGSGGSIVGFVGYQPSTSAIFVSYRGSEDIQNWVTNMEFIRTDYPKCSGCSVHKGFYAAMKDALPIVQQAVADLHSKYPSYNIVCTGHSLGAALATLTALELAGTYGSSKTHVYNYGSPRIFNDKGADYASSGAIKLGARRTHYKDMVPHVPPEVFGFRHIAGEIYENGPISNWPDFPGGPLKDCSGEEDTSCADQYDGTSIDDHLMYSGVKMGSGGCSALA